MRTYEVQYRRWFKRILAEHDSPDSFHDRRSRAAGLWFQPVSGSIDNAVNISATVADTNVRTDSSRRGSTDYQAEIDFNYSFEGEDYTSGFIYPLDDDREFSTEEEAQEFLQSYSAGTEVDAYVSPETPDEAFLNNESSDQPLIFLLIGGLMTLSAGYKTVKNIV